MGSVFGDILSSEIFAEEYFVANVQAKLSNLLDEKGVSRAELARKLDVSRARVTQIFADEARNFTLRLLARSFVALGEEPVIITRTEYEELKSASERRDRAEKGESLIAEGMTAALVADLLKTNLASRPGVSDKPARRTDSSQEWANAGSNVLPFKERAHG